MLRCVPVSPRAEGKSCVRAGCDVIHHSGPSQDGAQTPAALQPSTLRALLSPKPFSRLCNAHSLSLPGFCDATGRLPAQTPATLRPAPSPSGRTAACSELCKHPVVSTTPRVHPGPGELTCCSSFQRDEESCKFPWPDLASPPGNFSLGHLAGSSKSILGGNLIHGTFHTFLSTRPAGLARRSADVVTQKLPFSCAQTGPK